MKLNGMWLIGMAIINKFNIYRRFWTPATKLPVHISPICYINVFLGSHYIFLLLIYLLFTYSLFLWLIRIHSEQVLSPAQEETTLKFITVYFYLFQKKYFNNDIFRTVAPDAYLIWKLPFETHRSEFFCKQSRILILISRFVCVYITSATVGPQQQLWK